MMKKILAYMPLLLMFLACSEDEQVVPDAEQQGKTIEVPFAITLSGTTDAGLKTRANEGDNPYLPPISGEADVDVVKLYVFSKEGTGNTDNNQDAGEYLYEKELEINNVTDADGTHTGTSDGAPISEQDKVATGRIELNTGNSYRILAIAYNSQSPAGYTADFEVGVTSLTTAKIALSNGNQTPELFSAYLYKNGDDREASANLPISGINENTQLLGHLYRAVGYVSITLENVDADVKTLQFWVEKFATSKEIYDQATAADLGNKSYAYPMGYVNENLGTKEVMVAEYTLPESNDGTATAVLSSFFFPLDDRTTATGSGASIDSDINNRGHFYVKAIKFDETETVYPVKSSISEYFDTIWHGIQERFVADNMFVIPINWQLSIYGEFEQLKSVDSNLWIDLRPMGVAGDNQLTPVE